MTTVDFRLCNILLEDSDRANDYPLLYCRTTKPIPYDDDEHTFLLFPYEKFDFASYFNLFSNVKWRRYTRVDNVHLHLEVRGDFEVIFKRVDATAGDPRRTELARKRIVSPDDFAVIDYEFTCADADFYGFEIMTYSICAFKGGYFGTYIDESLVRPVELAIITTTYHQEKFITENIRLFKEELLTCDEPVTEHVHLHVVDNGRTLDAAVLSGERVTVHPNKNVGGAGGFARGMIEAIRQNPPATHVLLMDDDVQFSLESYKRTFNLLSLVNDEYSDAFLSGAMLSYEKQDQFNEDVGYVVHSGGFAPAKPKLDLSDLGDVVACDTMSIHHRYLYAGWWYCCIPLAVVLRQGLPLPLFVRGDDTEYASRAHVPLMSMNGICVWHVGFAQKYRSVVERYQVMRNALIAQATTGVYEGVDFMAQIKHYAQLDTRMFNYDGVDLVIDAVEDFLRGPQWLIEADGAEIMKRQNEKAETFIDLETCDDPRIKNLDIDPARLFVLVDRFDAGLYDSRRNLIERGVDFATVNGHRLPDGMLSDEIALIPYHGWCYPVSEIRMHKQLLAVTRDGRYGVLRTMDRTRFNEVTERYERVMKRYEEEHEEIERRYAEAREKLTSFEFWVSYLGIG